MSNDIEIAKLVMALRDCGQDRNCCDCVRKENITCTPQDIQREAASVITKLYDENLRLRKAIQPVRPALLKVTRRLAHVFGTYMHPDFYDDRIEETIGMALFDELRKSDAVLVERKYDTESHEYSISATIAVMPIKEICKAGDPT